MAGWILLSVAVLGATPEASPLEFADRVKRLTVRIAVHEGDDEREGFGIVLGERDGWLYIATANHVVRGNSGQSQESGGARPKVVLTYFTDQGVAYDGSVLENYISDFDLGVIKARAPAGFRSEALCNDSPNVARGTRVAYVGKERSWYVPTTEGQVNQEPDAKEWLNVDGMTVEPGTSGAPVFSGYGLVGVVVNSAKLQTFVAGLDRVERAFHGWNYPFGGARCVSRNSAETKARVSFRDLPAHEAVPEAPGAQGLGTGGGPLSFPPVVFSTAATASSGPAAPASPSGAATASPAPPAPASPSRTATETRSPGSSVAPKVYRGATAVQILTRSRSTPGKAFVVTPAPSVQTTVTVSVRGPLAVADIRGSGFSCLGVPLGMLGGHVVMQPGSACLYRDAGGGYTLRVLEGTISPQASGVVLRMEAEVTDVDGPPQKKSQVRNVEARLKFAFDGTR
jgi:hypothetical protein